MRTTKAGWLWISAGLLLTVTAGSEPVWAAREAKARPGEEMSDADYAAERMLRRAQDLVLAQEGERAVRTLRAIIEQYPTSTARHKAYLALGKYYIDNFDFNQAITYLAQVRRLETEDELSEELKDLVVQSLYLTGVTFYKMREYDRAFPVLRKITVDHANTVWANQAYYYIGMCHFVQEHWKQAVDALSMVGTYFDPGDTSAEFVEAGRRLFIKIEDGDLPVLFEMGQKARVAVESSKGDRVVIDCLPLSSGRNVFVGSVATQPGQVVTNDMTLQVIGGDKLTATYVDVNTQDGEKDIPRYANVKVVSTGGLRFTLGDYETLAKHTFIEQPVFVSLYDVDLDISAEADSATIKVLSRYRVEEEEQDGEASPGVNVAGFSDFLEEKREEYRVRDEMNITLDETGTGAVHTGRFLGTFKTAPLVPGEDIDKTDETLVCAEDDELVAVYVDQLHIAGEFPREVQVKLKVGGSIDTSPQASQNVVFDEMVKARANLVEANAFLELARIFNDMGLVEGAAENADSGLARVNYNIKTEAPLDPSLREEAFKLKWELHLVKKDYAAAIATCQAFNAMFPDSPFVDQALLGIGRIHLENKNYAQAMSVFQRILKLTLSTAKAEAQFLIAQTVETSGQIGRGRSPLEQAFPHYKAVAINYPDSGFAGIALGKMIDYQIQTKDYQEAANLLTQVFQDYPDAGFLDEMLLKWVMVAFRMGEFRTAHDKCTELIFQYPGSKYAKKAKDVLPTIKERL